VITTARREQEFSLGRVLGEPPATADMAKSTSTSLFEKIKPTHGQSVRTSVASRSVWAFPEQQWGRRGGVPFRGLPSADHGRYIGRGANRWRVKSHSARALGRHESGREPARYRGSAMRNKHLNVVQSRAAGSLSSSRRLRSTMTNTLPSIPLKPAIRTITRS
jgi:hypothetical protein